ncbi:thioredoxin-like protein [Cucurbitaria berberidis CBS 394.84]|uniref:Thioredoxin-like protein n=1 Tax=Cucurbitaria berberidis CBS 394.84 TaxID=1168544 RepID=A0A9P4LAT4_9PLEO|nr:thioredoxin-like protein [Cucurbitaria berberidis CBS 394.84]KAF1847519.1 thioredoxin-like protein [Cucurbitaria berberidis CBS 394.84]
MSALGHVRIGHKAPYFRCEAVVGSTIEEVSLSTYIHPSVTGSTPNPDAPWLIILFIPAAFSFVCPTEVLAFQNCHDEFKDRNCNVIFVSVDTKHSLWHWQNVPRQYGGLGKIDIPLLSDANHHLSRDYGVLIEDEGVSLRGMFILDGEGIVQQVTLNNLTVGRSVLEALRLLEAFQAVAKHGVLCPVDWKPNSNTSDTISTISNTLTESYDDRLANLQKEFGDIKVTDLDAKHGSEPNSRKSSEEAPSPGPPIKAASPSPVRSNSIQEVICERPNFTNPTSTFKQGYNPRVISPPPLTPSSSSQSVKPTSAPPSANPTPVPTPNTTGPPALDMPALGPPRHTRGTSFHLNMDHRYVNTLFSSPSDAPSMFQTLIRHISSPTDSLSGNSTPSSTPLNQAKSPAAFFPTRLAKHNTYETRHGSHIILEFADPTSSPTASPSAGSAPSLSPPVHRQPSFSRGNSPALSRATSWGGTSVTNGWARKSSDPTKETASTPARASSQTRLQATFETIKKMSAGLASPRLEAVTRRSFGRRGPDTGTGEEAKSPGYFDVVVEAVET